MRPGSETLERGRCTDISKTFSSKYHYSTDLPTRQTGESFRNSPDLDAPFAKSEMCLRTEYRPATSYVSAGRAARAEEVGEVPRKRSGDQPLPRGGSRHHVQGKVLTGVL